MLPKSKKDAVLIDQKASKRKAATSIGENQKKKIKPPTLEEINELKETRNLFHSNLFRLQVKEMLEVLKVKEKYKTYLNDFIQRFQKFLDNLSTQENNEDMDVVSIQEIREQVRQIEKAVTSKEPGDFLNETPIKIPLTLNGLRNEKRKFQFQFIKPTTAAYFIGAAATETFVGCSQLNADICVTMPCNSFQKDDYLNFIYDEKRALYLVYIAKEIIKQCFEDIELSHLKFSYHGNNPMKPVLVITPPNKINSKEKISIRIYIAAEETTFKLNRFVPWNNNIRCKILQDISEDDCNENAPTPHYNANVLFDLTMETNHQLLCTTFKGCKNFREALVLLKVWLQQRQLQNGFTGFSSYMLAMFMCYLQRQRKLHQNMSSYQVARTVWNQLAHSTWETPSQGISLHTKSESNVSNQPTVSQFHEHYDVVFIDSSGYYNICANLSLEIYRRVRLEAKIAVDMLNDMKMNSFNTIFMSKFPLYTQFDHTLKIGRPDVVEQILEMHVPLSLKQDYFGYAFPQLLKVVNSLLQKGLGQRVQTILPIEQIEPAWACTNPPNPDFGQNLQLGLILDPMHAYEILDKGPGSIDSAAEEFRRFWGDKAKLRRFQDGSITESIVWATANDTLAQKRLVTRSIVLHLLQHHFQLESNDIIYIAGELDIIYKLTTAFKTERMHEKFKVDQDTDAELLCLRVIQIYDDLAKKLHALKELPLEIVSIVGVSAVFRYCEPSPLLPLSRNIGENMYASSVQHGIIQLAASGKWPNELTAFHAMKTAFYIQIAQLIREKYKLMTKVTYDGILVVKQGYCFSIEIAHPKELTLLKQTKTERGIIQYIDSTASIALEKRHYVLPKVTGALHALHHQHSSFGGTVMIAKRWLYAQLIDRGLWPDECTELLIASQYLKAICNEQITCSPQTGFIRFLQLIAYSDWGAELFLLNFNGSMDVNEISELEQKFATEREQFPPLCIATAYDRGHYGKLWTSAQQPNVNVLARVTLLARQALQIIESSLFSPTERFIRPSKLFVPSTQGYDLVIQLKPEEITNTTGYDFGSAFSALTKPNWRLPLAGAEFLDKAVSKLREAYGDFAAFFYNPCGGGKIIGIVWRPNVFDEKDFKFNEVQACHPKKNQKVQCARETLIEDFKFILKDFYMRIDTVEAIISNTQICKVVTTKKAKAAATSITSKLTKQRYFNDNSVKPTVKRIEESLAKSTSVKKTKNAGKISKAVKIKKEIET